MREDTRFAWGTSSLGDFLVALAGHGLVALSATARCGKLLDATPQGPLTSGP